MTHLRSVLAPVALGVILSLAPASAAEPVFHGNFLPVPGKGRLDESAGTASLTSGRWIFVPAPASNGIAPDRELVQMLFGEVDELAIPAGEMRASRNGRRFTYVYRRPDDGSPPSDHGIRKMTLTRLKNGRWLIRASFVGINLSTLLAAPAECRGIALVIGDDDGFQGVLFERPSSSTSRVRITGTCEAEEWPWL